jgi:ubiquinone/menaquinone biosynthesis C-methylase UbiE
MQESNVTDQPAREVTTQIVAMADKPVAGHVWRSAAEMHQAREFRRRTGFDYEVMVNHLADAAGLITGCRVLNVATGTGFVARQLAIRGDAKGTVFGIDPEPEMIDQARLGAQAAGLTLRTEWRVATADNLPFQDGEFDSVTCAASFHLLPTEAFLHEAHRVLRAGGRLVIADELKSPAGLLSPWLAVLRGYDRVVRRQHTNPNEQFFHAEEIVGILSEAGFSQIVVKGLQPRNRRGRVFSLVKATK